MPSPLPDPNAAHIAVIGLGYVGLPLAVAFGKRQPTIGYDIDENRIEQLSAGHDPTREVAAEDLASAGQLHFAHNPKDSSSATPPNASTPATPPTASTNVVKVTAGATPEAAEFIDALYGSIIDRRHPPGQLIRVAEAAKVIENTQRDLNIALVNELALIFNRWASTPPKCSRPPVPSGTSCPFGPAWSAATASASTPTT
jgi:UDP-N-acetyl-D-mannosaminuronate dehydrogenase